MSISSVADRPNEPRICQKKEDIKYASKLSDLGVSLGQGALDFCSRTPCRSDGAPSVAVRVTFVCQACHGTSTRVLSRLSTSHLSNRGRRSICSRKKRDFSSKNKKDEKVLHYFEISEIFRLFLSL